MPHADDSSTFIGARDREEVVIVQGRNREKKKLYKVYSFSSIPAAALAFGN